MPSLTNEFRTSRGQAWPQVTRYIPHSCAQDKQSNLERRPACSRLVQNLRKTFSVGLIFLLLSASALIEGAPVPQEVSRSTQAQFAYKAGMKLVQAKRFDEAIETFQRGLHAEATSLVLLNAIGATYSLKGNLRDARHYFLKVLTLDPRFEPARKNLAIGYFDSGQYELAAREFEVLDRNSESRPVASLFLGMIGAEKKQYARAAELLGQAGELVFQYPRALVSFAEVLSETGELAKSRLVLDRLRSVPDVSPAQWLEAGEIYARLGQYPSALEDLEKAKQQNPESPATDLARSLVLDRMGRSKEALEILQALVSKKPDASSLNLLAHVAENAGDIDVAIQSFRKAAEIEPGREENYLDYSTLCMNHRNYPLALEVVEVGLSYVPNSYRLRVQKGAVLAELGRLREAREDFRAAMKVQVDDREALLSLARVQVRDGELKDSVETLATATGKYPNDFYIQYYYAFLLLELTKRQGLKGENIEKALRALNRSIRLNPDFPKSYLLLGKIYLDRDPQFAVKQFETCLRLDPQSASAKYQLGRRLLRMGKREEGEKLLGQVNEQVLQEEKEENTSRIQLVRR